MRDSIFIRAEMRIAAINIISICTISFLGGCASDHVNIVKGETAIDFTKRLTVDLSENIQKINVVSGSVTEKSGGATKVISGTFTPAAYVASDSNKTPKYDPIQGVSLQYTKYCIAVGGGTLSSSNATQKNLSSNDIFCHNNGVILFRASLSYLSQWDNTLHVTHHLMRYEVEEAYSDEGREILRRQLVARGNDLH